MNKIEVEIPENVQQITNATNGVLACLVMLFCGVVKGLFAGIRYIFGGMFRVVAGAVAGGYAAAQSK